MKVAWDWDKYVLNLTNHEVDFEDLVPMFESGDFDITYDADHSSHDQDRYHAVAFIAKYGMVLTVFIEEIEDQIHIISARRV